MTTTASGGKITGLLALTMVGSTALALGDFVMVTGDYTVSLADGTKPVIGHVSVRNVKRTSDANSTSYPVNNPGGDVTVEAIGFYVKVHPAGAAITAGEGVGMNATGQLVPDGAGVAHLGVALTGAAAAATNVDVLVGA
jgi:hypothetical protein